jgi:hypothetical protein
VTGNPLDPGRARALAGTAVPVHQPTGIAFTVVLMVHVAAVLVTVVAVVASARSAGRLPRAADGPVPDAVRSYFSEGVNWAGRALYVVPVAGAALVGMSGGDYRFGDAWVVCGFALWVAAIALGEAVLWRSLLGTGGVAAGGEVPEGASGVAVPAAPAAEALAACRAIGWASAGILSLVIGAMAVMFARP